MSREDDETPVERPRKSSSVTLQWAGNVDAWLAMKDGRYIVWTGGLVFRVVDEAVGEEIVRVGPDEELTAAIWRRGVLALIARASP